jgi:hypothetical protein
MGFLPGDVHHHRMSVRFLEPKTSKEAKKAGLKAAEPSPFAEHYIKTSEHFVKTIEKMTHRADCPGCKSAKR